ncbi:MAG: hypothetical protein IT405_01800 [Candidatus Yanofskybacteria bacterium]|nr:hypothetical protein [Candidatus Yanofskybacteria bacterium]
MSIFQRRRYQVAPDRDEWVAPEETLIDAGSHLSAIEVPVGDGVFRTAYAVAGMLCALLTGTVLWLGVIQHGHYGTLSARNRTVNVSVPPPRGIIMDRTGKPLVQNVPSFDLLVISRQVIRESGALRGMRELAATLERSPEELSLELEDALRKNAVFFAATDLSRAQVLALKDRLPPGFSIITSTKRNYLDSAQFSHVIGYVGKVSRTDMVADEYYLPSDTIGRLGVEAQYEDVLRGTHGQLQFQPAQGTESTPAEAGENVVLALDADAQKVLWNSVWDILRESGLSEAAAIAQDPRDGSVLGMVSFPSYDNNVFNGARLSQEDFERLFNSRARPLFNRAISGRYNPGSTIKPFIGMTALQERIVRADQVVNYDCISISMPNPSNPSDPYVFKNWRPDTGAFDLNRAIADSCNVYFYTVGGGYGSVDGLGVTRIIKYLAAAFADHVLGIDLPGEETGFIPSPEWKHITTKEPWYQGDTYNISIGQGDLLVTPLWLNTMVSAIANGGTLWQPKVVRRVVDDQRATVRIVESEQVGTLPFSPDVITAMQKAMRGTVVHGTARLLSDLPVTAAAKTGTAEVVKGQRINSLLTVYAPAEHPEIALTVLIEGSASNQGYALRVAHRFLQWYFGAGRGTPAPSASLSPSP